VVADDWKCIETGPVSDIHFWFSYKQDQQVPITGVHASIHEDVPAMPGTYSHPGKLLWERDFSITSPEIKIAGPFSGPGQGWFDPRNNQFNKPDHNLYWQMNITNIKEPFVQELGTIYWLDLSIFTPAGVPQTVGWKTSKDHFNDDAVWGVFPTPEWKELRDPITQESLDMAFVITPEPSSLALLLLGALLGVPRR
jgi:hypothetical protein